MIEANITKESKLLNIKVIFNIIITMVTACIIFFLLYIVKIGIFDDKLTLTKYITKFGIYAPIAFLLLQIIQVAFPIIPGGISCLVGVLAFGPTLGFIYNYVGVILGSCLAYFLSQKYGLNLIKKLFKEKTINKYINHINQNKFQKIFQVGIIMPGLPDDLLCYIAGISQIKFKTFLLTLVLGKPLTLLGYSIFIEFL